MVSSPGVQKVYAIGNIAGDCSGNYTLDEEVRDNCVAPRSAFLARHAAVM